MKTLFTTGANGGLALETLKQLQSEDFTDIYLGCRSIHKANTTQHILEQTGKFKGNYHPIEGMDMLNPLAIKNTIEALPKDLKIDTVFLGAGGVIFTEDYNTVTFGNIQYEKTIFQNVIGGCIVVYLLKKHNLLKDNARVVIAGGEGARGIPGMIAKPTFKNKTDFKNYLLGNFNNAKQYNPMNAIGVSKFVSAIWCRILKDSGINLETLWFSPGLTYGTNGLDTMPVVKQWFMKSIGFPFARILGMAQSPSDGGFKFAKAISGVIGKNGDILGAPEGKTLGPITNQIPMNTDIDNPEFKKVLSQILQEIYPKL